MRIDAAVYEAFDVWKPEGLLVPCGEETMREQNCVHGGPPEVPYRHVAMRAVRRVLIEPEDVTCLTEFMNVIANDPEGPWIGNAFVDAFVRAHQLPHGDIIDLSTSGA